MSEHVPGAASCALHPDAPALGICDRCGAYMCPTCSEGGTARLCPVCRARTGAAAFPLRRDAWTLDALFGIAWRAFTGGIIPIVVSFLIIEGIYMALAFIPQLVLSLVVKNPNVLVGAVVVVTLVDVVVVTSLVLGLLDMCFDALDGRQARIETLFWHFGKVGRLLRLLLLVFLVAVLPMGLFEVAAGAAAYLATRQQTAPAVLTAIAALALLVGALWLLLPMTFAQFELALDDEVGPVQALTRSFALARGKRWAILGVGFLAGLAAMAGMLLCGIGMVVSVPFAYVVMAALFLTLRNGSGLPPPVRLGRRAREEALPVPPAASSPGA